MIKVKRVYEPASAEDGWRVLVDRVWPRGLTRQRVAADAWLKELAPSSELRKWFGHDRAKWKQFKARYRKELRAHAEALRSLSAKSRGGRVTLLYGAKDEERNQAVALKEFLDGAAREKPRPQSRVRARRA